MRHEPTKSSIEGMKARLRSMEQQIADLQRVRNPPPQDFEPPGGGDSEIEGFRATMTGGTASSGGGFQSPEWSFTSGATAYATPGVSLSNWDRSIDLSAGFWVLTLQFDVFTNTSAGSGEFLVGLGNDEEPYDGAGERKAYTHWPFNGARANFHLTLHTYLPAGSSYSVFHQNGLNVAGTITGQLSGTRVGDAPSVSFGS